MGYIKRGVSSNPTERNFHYTGEFKQDLFHGKGFMTVHDPSRRTFVAYSLRATRFTERRRIAMERRGQDPWGLAAIVVPTFPIAWHNQMARLHQLEFFSEQ